MKRGYRNFAIMPISRDIFRSYDIRGLLEEVTPQVATATARVLVRKLQAKHIIVGRDARATSPALLEAAVRGIEAEGATAVVIGECSTSVFNFAVTATGQADGGIMITASHNPAQYNGIKCADATGQPFPGQELAEPVLALAEEEIPQQEVRPEAFAALQAYVDACLEGANAAALQGMKVAVDYGNGMGAAAFQAVSAKLGLELYELYAEPDANFPNHEANPALQETLHDLQALIARTGAALGIAFDGDADRIGIVDEQGTVYRGDQLLGLLAEAELKERDGGKVILQPSHSWSTREAVERAGGTWMLRPVGRTRVIEGMRTEKAIMGGEVSGHIFFDTFANSEAVDYAAIKVLSLLAQTQQPLSTLMQPFTKYPSSGEVNLHINNPKEAIARVKEIYAPQATNVETMDGLRCDYNHDWLFLVRASSTEPILRLIVEATSAELVQEKVAEITAALA